MWISFLALRPINLLAKRKQKSERNMYFRDNKNHQGTNSFYPNRSEIACLDEITSRDEFHIWCKQKKIQNTEKMNRLLKWFAAWGTAINRNIYLNFAEGIFFCFYFSSNEKWAIIYILNILCLVFVYSAHSVTYSNNKRTNNNIFCVFANCLRHNKPKIYCNQYSFMFFFSCAGLTTKISLKKKIW